MRGGLRSGAWVTPQRIRHYALMLLLTMLAGVAYLIVTAQGLNDYKGRPLGTDFSNVYAAGTYVREGRPAAPFVPRLQEQREREIFGADTQFYGWHYPPYFLLIAAALAAFPYLWALALWQGATFGLYLAVQWRLWPQRLPLLLAASFPAVFINLGHGHNGFLTAALLGGGLALLPTRPFFAGLVLGLLAYKPQFAVLIPIALMAGGYWRAILGGALSVAALTVLVSVLWGMDIWQAFMESSHFTRTVVLEEGMTGFHKIQTAFAWARLWGAPVPLAYALQALVALLATVGVVRLWRHRALAMEYKAAGLVLGCLLFTPYMLDYDLMVLAPALAWCTRGGLRDGFRDYEKSLLALAWIAPFVTRTLADHAAIPLALWVMLALMLLVVRRARS